MPKHFLTTFLKLHENSRNHSSGWIHDTLDIIILESSGSGNWLRIVKWIRTNASHHWMISSQRLILYLAFNITNYSKQTISKVLKQSIFILNNICHHYLQILNTASKLIHYFIFICNAQRYNKRSVSFLVGLQRYAFQLVDFINGIIIMYIERASMCSTPALLSINTVIMVFPSLLQCASGGI